jgi:histidinol phosphatase-like enzyme
MISEILKNWDVNIKKSLMIGDKKIDQQCAERSKLKFIYYSKNIFSDVKKQVKIH